MEVNNGKCVICTENSNVLAIKDRQKFLDLINIYYFEENKTNGDQFFSLFNTKNSDNSICISCAYKINCYIEMRKNFQAQSAIKRKSTCSICLSQTNLTNGTDQLKKDALCLLMTSKKTVSRIAWICLNCCFAITSWNFIQHSIEKFVQEENEQNGKQNNGKKKRRYSVVEPNDDTLPKRSKRMLMSLKSTPVHDDFVEKKQNNNIKKTKITVKNNIKKTKVTIKNNKKDLKKNISANKNRYKFNNLTHLIQVSKLSKINLSPEIESDRRMMCDIPYVLCKLKKHKPAKMTMTDEVIEISDSESDASEQIKETTVGVRQSSRISKRQRKQFTLFNIMEDSSNQCAYCPKKYKKKYRLQLHLLEHESSFSPQVLIGDKEKNPKSSLNEETNESSENSQIVENDKESNVENNNKTSEDEEQVDKINEENEQKKTIEFDEKKMELSIDEEESEKMNIVSFNKEKEGENKLSQNEKNKVESPTEEESDIENIRVIDEKNETTTLNNDETIEDNDEEIEKEDDKSSNEENKESVQNKPEVKNCNNKENEELDKELVKENKTVKSSPQNKKKKTNLTVKENEKDDSSQEEKQNAESSEKRYNIEEKLSQNKTVNISPKNENKKKKAIISSNDDSESVNENEEECMKNDETEKINEDKEKKDIDNEVEMSSNEDNEIENSNHNKEKIDDVDAKIPDDDDDGNNDAEEKYNENKNIENNEERQEENNDNLNHQDTNENDEQNNKKDTSENKNESKENDKSKLFEGMDDTLVTEDKSLNKYQEIPEKKNFEEANNITPPDNLEMKLNDDESPEKLQKNGIFNSDKTKSAESDEKSENKENNTDSAEESEIESLKISPDSSQRSPEKEINMRDLPVETNKNDVSVDKFQFVENILENLGA